MSFSSSAVRLPLSSANGMLRYFLRFSGSDIFEEFLSCHILAFRQITAMFTLNLVLDLEDLHLLVPNPCHGFPSSPVDFLAPFLLSPNAKVFTFDPKSAIDDLLAITN